jgi:hypothetical protein
MKGYGNVLNGEDMKNKILIILLVLFCANGYAQKPKHFSFGPQLGYTYVTQTQRKNVQLIGNLQYRYKNFTIGFQSGWAQNLGTDQIDFRMGTRLQYNIITW